LFFLFQLNWSPSEADIAAAVARGNPPPPADAKCTIFLAYTSNLISSGLRESFLYLVKNKMVDCVITTAGGIEEDFIKCLAPTYLGDFKLKGSDLRAKGLNRCGNLLVPNDNYCKFEDWVSPILHKMTDEQVGIIHCKLGSFI
jgi:deoxyhypusine synthase